MSLGKRGILRGGSLAAEGRDRKGKNRKGREKSVGVILEVGGFGLLRVHVGLIGIGWIGGTDIGLVELGVFALIGKVMGRG